MACCTLTGRGLAADMVSLSPWWGEHTPADLVVLQVIAVLTEADVNVGRPNTAQHAQLSQVGISSKGFCSIWHVL